MSREAMQKALAYIEEVDYGPYDKWPVIIALKQALAEPEPVIDKTIAKRIATQLGWEPPKKPLSEDEIAQAMYRADAIVTGPMQFRFAKEIERAHGIKEQEHE